MLQFFFLTFSSIIIEICTLCTRCNLRQQTPPHFRPHHWWKCHGFLYWILKIPSRPNIGVETDTGPVSCQHCSLGEAMLRENLHQTQQTARKQMNVFQAWITSLAPPSCLPPLAAALQLELINMRLWPRTRCLLPETEPYATFFLKICYYTTCSDAAVYRMNHPN